MSPVDRDVVRRKLARIVQALGRLRRERDLPLEAYLAQPDLQAVLERQLELVVGAAVDLNVHMLVQQGHATPADAFTSFLELARLTGAIDGELAAQLAPSTGLRNRLAHSYDEVDPALVYSGLKAALELYPRYVAAIEAFLERLEAGQG